MEMGFSFPNILVWFDLWVWLLKMGIELIKNENFLLHMVVALQTHFHIYIHSFSQRHTKHPL